MSQSERAETFRRLHEQTEAFVIPNPWDTGTARILAGLGFQALATTSAGMAFSLGRRDGNVKREDALSHCEMLSQATDLPVSADLENGYGDSPDLVSETIRLAAATGLVGGSIEDASGNPDNPIYDFGLARERIEAAVAARDAFDFSFTLTARAENFLHGRPDLDDTIARLQAFEAAGADVLFAPGIRDIDQIRTVCAAVGKPVNVLIGMARPPLSVAELSAAGVKRVSVGALLSRAALGGFIAAAQELKEHGTADFAKHAATFADLNGFMT